MPSINGFSISINLTKPQIKLFNQRIGDWETYKVRAELYCVDKAKIPLAMLPKTKIESGGEVIRIYGSPNVIEVILFQLFE